MMGLLLLLIQIRKEPIKGGDPTTFFLAPVENKAPIPHHSVDGVNLSLTSNSAKGYFN